MAMDYSRQNPSPRYMELLRMYRDMHLYANRLGGADEKLIFDGQNLAPQARRIKRLIETTGAARILDYGSGKGLQYDAVPYSAEGEGQWDGIIDYWGVDEVVCFDPAYPPYSRLPEGRFDGVVCTDVLEHCPEEDIGWIVAEIFAFATRFVYATIACYPACKQLPNGENAHCTVKPAKWWEGLFARTAAARAEVEWEVWVQKSSPVSHKHIDEIRLGRRIGQLS